MASLPTAATTILLTCLLFNHYQQDVDAKVVVLFSVPHAANVRTHTNIGRALTQMGHDAYVCIPQFMIDEKKANVDGIKVINYGDYLGNFDNTIVDMLPKNFWEGEAQGITDLFKFKKFISDFLHKIFSDKVLMTTLEKIKPDLFVITHVPPFINFVTLPYIFNVPFVFLTPFANLPLYRVPFSPSVTGCQFNDGFSENGLSFMDRLKNFGCNTLVVASNYLMADDSFIAKYAPARPQIGIVELAQKAEVYLLESDHILEYARPLLPNIKLIGCTAPTTARPLKDPFKKFVDSSKNGVALVSFGSSIINTPEKIAQKLISAFQKQDLNVIWRVNISSPNPMKILASTWVPQNDILAHEKTKLFVSHCGANSQYEALYQGVPLLCLPLNGDQFYNAQRSAARGFGLTGRIPDLTDDDIANLMKEVTNNAKYRDNIKKGSELFRLLYKLPEKEAAFWIDHVMQYGGAYMRSEGQNIPWYQFLAIDIFAVIGLVLMAVCLVLYGVARCCCGLCRRCCGGKEKKEAKSKKTQ